MPKVSSVFTPSDTPTVTYVDRSSLGFEKTMQEAVSIPNMIVSVSGPSKSGKTVLIRKVIPPETLIPVAGSGIRSAEDLWDNVLGWIEAPSETVAVSGSDITVKAQGSLTAKASVIVASGQLGTTAGVETGKSSTTSTTTRSGGLAQVVREIANSDFVVFIDDFHYIPRELQEVVARMIKGAAESGVKVVTASVPHRSDDVVRANPELRGRVRAIDLDYWSIAHLKRIARLGFTALNVDLSPDVEEKLAHEAFGSPQLMQTLCLNLCFQAGITASLSSHQRIDVDQRMLDEVFLKAASFADYSTLLEVLHAGPKQRGTERKQFTFTDKSTGDVYRSLLLAVSKGEPKLSLRYDEMIERVRSVCVGEAPVGSSVSEALSQMEKLSKLASPLADVLEWDEDVLEIVEPYFLFFLRCSSKLESLAR